MPFLYGTGEEIKKGDRVTFHGESGNIECVVDNLTGDKEMDWYAEEFGGGVMLVEPKVMGRVFLTKPENAEDLIFVARASATA